MDIEKNLGKRQTFSAECPYGTENDRVMEYAHKIFPALRNRMPEPWLEERVIEARSPVQEQQRRLGAHG